MYAVRRNGPCLPSVPNHPLLGAQGLAPHHAYLNLQNAWDTRIVDVLACFNCGTKIVVKLAVNIFN